MQIPVIPAQPEKLASSLKPVQTVSNGQSFSGEMAQAISKTEKSVSGRENSASPSARGEARADSSANNSSKQVHAPIQREDEKSGQTDDAIYSMMASAGMPIPVKVTDNHVAQANDAENITVSDIKDAIAPEQMDLSENHLTGNTQFDGNGAEAQAVPMNEEDVFAIIPGIEDDFAQAVDGLKEKPEDAMVFPAMGNVPEQTGDMPDVEAVTQMAVEMAEPDADISHMLADAVTNDTANVRGSDQPDVIMAAPDTNVDNAEEPGLFYSDETDGPVDGRIPVGNDDGLELAQTAANDQIATDFTAIYSDEISQASTDSQVPATFPAKSLEALPTTESNEGVGLEIAPVATETSDVDDLNGMRVQQAETMETATEIQPINAESPLVAEIVEMAPLNGDVTASMSDEAAKSQMEAPGEANGIEATQIEADTVQIQADMVQPEADIAQIQTNTAQAETNATQTGTAQPGADIALTDTPQTQTILEQAGAVHGQTGAVHGQAGAVHGQAGAVHGQAETLIVPADDLQVKSPVQAETDMPALENGNVALTQEASESDNIKGSVAEKASVAGQNAVTQPEELVETVKTLTETAAPEVAQSTEKQTRVDGEKESRFDILEGSAPTDGTDAREALPAAGEAGTDVREEIEPNAAARMPKSQEPMMEASKTVSFLENVDQAKALDQTTVNTEAPTEAEEAYAAAVPKASPMESDPSSQNDAKPKDGAVNTSEPTPLPLTGMTQATAPFAQESSAEVKAPLPPVEQIALEATLSQGVGKNNFTMRLNPESLGEVTVRMTLGAQGVIARITVTNEEARVALAQQLQHLGESMREKGIEVRTIELSRDYTGAGTMLHDGNRGSAGQQNNPPPRWKYSRPRPQAEAIAAMESYDQTLITQISVADTQTVNFEA